VGDLWFESQSLRIKYNISTSWDMIMETSVTSFIYRMVLKWYKFKYIYSQTGGPSWPVPLGRRDSLTTNVALANQNLPSPTSNLTELKSKFAAQGLNTVDLVTLSGKYTYNIFLNKLSIMAIIDSYVFYSITTFK
jgi:hypothetical protein